MGRSVGTFALAMALAAVVGAGSPAVARAQTPAPMDERPSYQDSTGLTWSVATLELGLALSAVAVALSGPQDAATVGVLMLAVSAVASAVAAGVAQGLNAPVEPPMIFHHGVVGAALVGGLVSFSLRTAGVRGDTPSYLGIGGLILGAAGAITYSALRMQPLAHDPDLLEEAHVLSWAPILTAGLLSAVLGAAGLGDAAGLIGAACGMAAWGIAVALAEVEMP